MLMEIYHERGDDVDWICWSGGVRRSVTVLGNERFAVCSTLVDVFKAAAEDFKSLVVGGGPRITGRPM